jgi:hypothetical protein
MYEGNHNQGAIMSRGLQLDVPDELFQRIQTKADEAGCPVEAVAISWLEAEGKRESIRPARAAADPLESFIGTMDSGGIAWTEKHDDFLGKQCCDTHDAEVRDPS